MPLMQRTLNTSCPERLKLQDLCMENQGGGSTKQTNMLMKWASEAPVRSRGKLLLTKQIQPYPVTILRAYLHSYFHWEIGGLVYNVRYYEGNTGTVTVFEQVILASLVVGRSNIQCEMSVPTRAQARGVICLFFLGVWA